MMKFSIKDLPCKCDHIRSEKPLMENFIFCALIQSFIESTCKFFGCIVTDLSHRPGHRTLMECKFPAV